MHLKPNHDPARKIQSMRKKIYCDYPPLHLPPPLTWPPVQPISPVSHTPNPGTMDHIGHHRQ